VGCTSLITALAGGVGASKLLTGLKHVLYPRTGKVVVNTADDEEFFGLHVSPDIDTVVYSLAGLADDLKGWGVAGDTFHALGMLERLGCETWFKLGDRDLAVHIYRTMRLRSGATLTQVTREVAARLNAGWDVLPMTDDRVRTVVETPVGTMSFQEYFVKHQYKVGVRSVRFEGVERAEPTPQVVEALKTAEAVIICPSNPVVSIGPILSLKNLRKLLRESEATILGVSPIVGGKALRGPAAEMMKALGVEPTAAGVASMYSDFMDLFVLDEADESLKGEVEALGVKAYTTKTVMSSFDDRVALAGFCLKVLGIRV
jgi:LPPG:FO 2-phospho-L-lactate transferase